VPRHMKRAGSPGSPADIEAVSNEPSTGIMGSDMNSLVMAPP